MSRDEYQFDDPALKSALKRAFQMQIAPDELRRRIAHLASVGGIGRPMRIWRSILKGSIAAAILFAIAGLLSWEYGLFDRPSQRVAYGTMGQLPPEVAQQMIHRHEEMASMSQPHQLTSSHDNLSQVRQELQQKLGAIKMAGLELGDPGWEFRGARLTAVAGQAAAELLYEWHGPGEQRVSIFILSAPPSCAGYGTGDYSLVSDGHPISGFLQGGGLYCVVGSSADGSLKPLEVDHIRQALQRQLTPPATMGAACHLPPQTIAGR